MKLLNSVVFFKAPFGVKKKARIQSHPRPEGGERIDEF
jgi:hypothetical protein